MHFLPTNEGEALEVAKGLVRVSRNISDVPSEAMYETERASVAERISLLSFYMRSYGYMEIMQRFGSDDAHVDDCQNTLWIHPHSHAITHIVTSHVDYCAGTGAQDNASGMGVMATVARQCFGEGNKHVAFIAFDAEEKGRRGSKVFVSHFRKLCAKNSRRVFLNIDSIGSGKLIQLRSYQNALELELPLPQVYADGLRTDAYTLLSQGLIAATLSSFDDNAIDSPLVPNRLRDMDKDTFFLGNFCNTERDTVEALHGPNMDAASDLVMKIISGISA